MWENVFLILWWEYIRLRKAVGLSAAALRWECRKTGNDVFGSRASLWASSLSKVKHIIKIHEGRKARSKTEVCFMLNFSSKNTPYILVLNTAFLNSLCIYRDSFACFCMAVLVMSHNVNEKSFSNRHSPKFVFEAIIIRALLPLFWYYCLKAGFLLLGRGKFKWLLSDALCF